MCGWIGDSDGRSIMAVLLEKRGVARLALSSAHQLQAVVTLVVHDFHGLMLGEGKIDCADSETTAG